MNGLKEEFPDRMHVVSVDVQSSLGKELSRDYGSFTPTFVFFDPGGEELWRMVGTLDAEKVRQTLP